MNQYLSRLVMKSIRSVGGGVQSRLSCSDTVEAEESEELEQLKMELADLEYEYGKYLVWLRRIPVRSRLKTIAREHVRSAARKTEHEWICEAKALARFVTKSNESDAEIALALLMPFELQYRNGRDI